MTRDRNTQNDRGEEQAQDATQATGSMPSLWTIRQMLPGAWRKPIRVHMAENEMDLGDVLEEALEIWAKNKGVNLPPRHNSLAWAS